MEKKVKDGIQFILKQNLPIKIELSIVTITTDAFKLNRFIIYECAYPHHIKLDTELP